jgi:hypothetical protein
LGDENQADSLARSAGFVKREGVMRDVLTFHPLRFTPVAGSANIAAEFFLQPTPKLFGSTGFQGVISPLASSIVVLSSIFVLPLC